MTSPRTLSRIDRAVLAFVFSGLCLWCRTFRLFRRASA